MERFINYYPDVVGGAKQEKEPDYGDFAFLARDYPDAAKAMFELIRIIGEADSSVFRDRVANGDIDGIYSALGISEEEARELYSGLEELRDVDRDELERLAAQHRAQEISS